MIAHQEGALSQRLIDETCSGQSILPGQFMVHYNQRSMTMKSKSLVLLYVAVFLVPMVPNIWFFPIFVLLLYLTLAFDFNLIRKDLSRQHLERVDLLVLIFLIFCSLSFLNVDLARRSLQNYLRYYFGSYLLPILSYFAFRLIRFSDERARSLRNAALASGIIFSMFCFYEFAFSHPLVSEFDNPDQWIDSRVLRAGTLAGGSVHAGETMAGFIALILPFTFFRWPGKHRFRFLLLLLITLTGLTVVFSRAAYISTLACLLAASLLFYGGRVRWLVVVTVILLLSLILVPLLSVPDWISARLMDYSSTFARVPRFWAGIDFIVDNVHMGWKTALFGRGYTSSYVWGGYYLQPGYGVSATPDFFLSGGFHNGYLTLLADQGILAFGCYMAILIVAGRRLWRYCRQLRSLERRRLRSPALLEPVGWGLILVVHLVTETVHWSSYFPQTFYFFMALAMLLNLTSSERPAELGMAIRQHMVVK